MIRLHKANATLLVLLALAIAGFWWLHPTTPERIGSLIFFVLVALYSLFAHRDDVLGACIIFFAAFDISQYLFDQILPVWIGVVGITLVAMLLWQVLFGRIGWFMAIAATLAALEVLLAMQYINLSISTQALLVATPFILVSQYQYFRAVRPHP